MRQEWKEKDFSKSLREYLRKQGLWAERIENTLAPGWPDLIVQDSTHTWWIETKTGSGDQLKSLSPHQRNFMLDCDKRGAAYILATLRWLPKGISQMEAGLCGWSLERGVYRIPEKTWTETVPEKQRGLKYQGMVLNKPTTLIDFLKNDLPWF